MPFVQAHHQQGPFFKPYNAHTYKILGNMSYEKYQMNIYLAVKLIDIIKTTPPSKKDHIVIFIRL